MVDNKRIQQLDLNLLKVFHTLFHEQNMTRTAEVLHLTPSAVSHAIKRLREALGDPLFRRSQNKMLPTPVCQRIAPQIIDNLTQIQQILQELDDFEPATSTHSFRIGMHDALEPSLLPQLTEQFSRLAPQISFSCVSVDRHNMARDLASNRMDVCLDVNLPIQHPVKQRKLVENEFVVLMRRHHAFADQLSIDNYLSATHLNVSNRPIGMTAEDSLFQERGITRKVTIRCQNYFAAREIVATSDQLLTLPRLLARHLQDARLIIQEVPVDIPCYSTHLYWHERSEQDAALKWLRSLFIDKIDLQLAPT